MSRSRQTGLMKKLRLLALMFCASLMAVSPAMACTEDQQAAAATRLAQLADNLDPVAARGVLAELCGVSIETQTFVPVAAAQAPTTNPASAAQDQESKADEAEETTRILGMEFRKADDDSEGLKRLRRKR